MDPSGGLIGIVQVPEVVGNLVWGDEDLRSLFPTVAKEPAAISQARMTRVDNG